LLPVYFCEIDASASLNAKTGRHFRTHFIATGTDSRSDGGQQIGGARVHGPKGLERDLGSRAAPPRMHGGDRAMTLVHQQDRQAIGRLHAHQTPRRAGQQRIALNRTARPIGMDRNVGMNLAKGNEAFGRGEEPVAKAVLKPVELGQRSRAVDVLNEFEGQNKLDRVLNLRDHDLLFEIFQHRLVQANFGGPLDESRHLVDLIL